jgi:hypothetical protein
MDHLRKLPKLQAFWSLLHTLKSRATAKLQFQAKKANKAKEI